MSNWYKHFKIATSDPRLMALVDSLKHTYPGLRLEAWANDTYIEVASIEVPRNQRSLGIGTKVMKAIQSYAQSINKKVVVRPWANKGKKTALDRFYRNNGFVHNHGRNMDYTLSTPFGKTMYWSPKNELV